MKRSLRLLCAAAMPVAMVAATLPNTASACTVAPGHVVPNALDLSRQTDTIVLAKIERQRRSSAADGLPTVVLRPMEAIKGSLPRDVLTLPGYVGSTQHVRASVSDPPELEAPHPQSLDGFCVRYVFMPGSTLLLFLQREGDQWQPIMAPFARVAEDVPSRRAR